MDLQCQGMARVMCAISAFKLLLWHEQVLRLPKPLLLSIAFPYAHPCTHTQILNLESSVPIFTVAIQSSIALQVRVQCVIIAWHASE